jgi:hypothetical protein
MGSRGDDGRSSPESPPLGVHVGGGVSRKRRYRDGNGKHRSRRDPKTSLSRRKRQTPVAAWPENVAIATETANTGRGVARKRRRSNRFGKRPASAHRTVDARPGVDRPTSTA